MPALALTALGGPDDAPLLLLGPSLGTDVTRLWSPVLSHLGGRWRVVGWDLPGHGHSPSDTGFDLAGLAAELLTTVEGPFAYAGVSVGGAVGLELCLAGGDRVASAAVICTGARIGTPEAWEERARLVEAEGTGAMVEGSVGRWYAPGFTGGHDLLDALPDVDDAGYAATCRALGAHDVRHRLSEISTPVVAVAGSADAATPPASLRAIADGVRHGRFVEIDGAAHLPTVEAPAAVAALLV